MVGVGVVVVVVVVLTVGTVAVVVAADDDNDDDDADDDDDVDGDNMKKISKRVMVVLMGKALVKCFDILALLVFIHTPERVSSIFGKSMPRQRAHGRMTCHLRPCCRTRRSVRLFISSGTEGISEAQQENFGVWESSVICVGSLAHP